jgi:hypothetical protein
MFDPTHPLYALIFPIDFPESCAVTSIRPPLVQPLPYCSPANGWSSWLNAENFKTTLKKIGDRYNKPILITESGIGESSLICGELPDCINRAKFLLEYIYVMGELIDEGYNIIGYLHWSDADNFEWSNGTNWRFGLNLVDFNDPKMPRIPSSGVPVYREIATNSKITRDTWAAYDQQLYSTDPRDLNTYDPLNPSNEWNVLGTTGYIRDSRWCSEASPEINGITASFVKLRVDSERIFRVDVDVDVSDHCDPAVNCKIKKITSKKDLEVTFNSALSADMGRKPGKYSIEIECLDVHGNEASRDFSLICSKNKKGILTCKQKKPKNRSFK